MSVTLTTQEIRKQVHIHRQKLNDGEVSELSQKVVKRFVGFGKVFSKRWEGVCVGLYRSLSFELDLEPLANSLIRAGCLLSYPRVVNRVSKEIEFIKPTNEACLQWQQGPYGIEEPHSDFQAGDPTQLEILFVPGVAFSMHGERIGMGQGYYDRFLSQHSQLLCIALAFDFQIFSSLEQNPWDRPMHWIVTESREYQASQVQEWWDRR